MKERDEYDKKIDSAPGSDCAAGAAAFMEQIKGIIIISLAKAFGQRFGAFAHACPKSHHRSIEQQKRVADTWAVYSSGQFSARAAVGAGAVDADWCSKEQLKNTLLVRGIRPANRGLAPDFASLRALLLRVCGPGRRRPESAAADAAAESPKPQKKEAKKAETLVVAAAPDAAAPAYKQKRKQKQPC